MSKRSRPTITTKSQVAAAARTIRSEITADIKRACNQIDKLSALSAEAPLPARKPASTKSAAKQKSSQPPAVFLSKLYHIVNELAPREVCDWSEDGTSFIVADSGRLSTEVLAPTFKSSKFPSFVRQLHFYGFRKTDKDRSIWEFKHENFLRGRPELLVKIKRKTSQEFSGTQRQQMEQLKREVKTSKASFDVLLKRVMASMAQMNPIIETNKKMREFVDSCTTEQREIKLELDRGKSSLTAIDKRMQDIDGRYRLLVKRAELAERRSAAAERRAIAAEQQVKKLSAEQMKMRKQLQKVFNWMGSMEAVAKRSSETATAAVKRADDTQKAVDDLNKIVEQTRDMSMSAQIQYPAPITLGEVMNTVSSNATSMSPNKRKRKRLNHVKEETLCGDSDDSLEPLWNLGPSGSSISSESAGATGMGLDFLPQSLSRQSSFENQSLSRQSSFEDKFLQFPDDQKSEFTDEQLEQLSCFFPIAAAVGLQTMRNRAAAQALQNAQPSTLDEPSFQLTGQAPLPVY